MNKPLGPDPNMWPTEERYLFYERWALIEFGSRGVSTEEARRLAEADVRRQVDTEKTSQTGKTKRVVDV